MKLASKIPVSGSYLVQYSANVATTGDTAGVRLKLQTGTKIYNSTLSVSSVGTAVSGIKRISLPAGAHSIQLSVNNSVVSTSTLSMGRIWLVRVG